MRHLIRKQVIDLILRRKQDAFRMQQLASEHYYHNMLPIIEKQFNEFSTEDELIQIDMLEIDLGNISEKQMQQMSWDNELVSRLGQLIKESLQQYSRQKQPLRQTMPAAYCSQWLFYMQKGYLPWNTIKANNEWRNKVLETLAVDFKAVSALRLLIEKNKKAVARMVMQHDLMFLTRLTEVLTAEKQTDLPVAIDEVYSLFKELEKQGWISAFQIPTKEVFQKTIWGHVLTIAASGEKDLNVTKLIARLLQLYPGFVKKNKKIPAAALDKLKIITGIIKELEKTEGVSEQKQDLKPDDNIKKKKLADNNEATKSITSAKTPDMAEDDPDTGEIDLLKRKDELPGNDDNILAMSTAEQIDEDGVFVVNAGIVLLHPFLSSFFKRIELVKETTFVDSSAKQKALYLLHYLATGQTNAEEHELVLPKVLCEWPLDMPVEKELTIRNDVYEEAMSLLESAVAQWEILKNSSVSGLREGFLQRPGKIFTKNDNLYLQVESNSIDILLDHLPWNLSIIKLPWMREILRVEWR